MANSPSRIPRFPARRGDNPFSSCFVDLSPDLDLLALTHRGGLETRSQLSLLGRNPSSRRVDDAHGIRTLRTTLRDSPGSISRVSSPNTAFGFQMPAGYTSYYVGRCLGVRGKTFWSGIREVLRHVYGHLAIG